MIELTLLPILDEALDVPVVLEVPEDRPQSYVLLQKTGSRRVNRLDRATFAVQNIAPTLYEAAVLNEQVKAVMDGLPYAAANVFRAELNSDYNFTDTETKERRYQAVYHITYKE